MSNPHKKPKNKKNQIVAKTQIPQSKQPTLPRVQRKRSFKDFSSLAAYAKQMVYTIVRVRFDLAKQTIQWQNLGTGFLVGNHRLMTCAHCINDPTRPTETMANHQDGDHYLLVQKDDITGYHMVAQNGIENTNLFIDKALDAAVFHLDDAFYKDTNGQYYKHPDMYLELATQHEGIGKDIGVLGYPFANINFQQSNADISQVYIRADKGVLNTYREDKNVGYYEFTVAFNPGNSGGPIFDINTGAVIGMVKGYHPVPTHWVEDLIPVGMIGNAKEQKHCYQLRTIYSYGISSLSLIAGMDAQHKLGKQ